MWMLASYNITGVNQTRVTKNVNLSRPCELKSFFCHIHVFNLFLCSIDTEIVIFPLFTVIYLNGVLLNDLWGFFVMKKLMKSDCDKMYFLWGLFFLRSIFLLFYFGVFFSVLERHRLAYSVYLF